MAGEARPVASSSFSHVSNRKSLKHVTDVPEISRGGGGRENRHRHIHARYGCHTPSNYYFQEACENRAETKIERERIGVVPATNLFAALHIESGIAVCSFSSESFF